MGGDLPGLRHRPPRGPPGVPVVRGRRPGRAVDAAAVPGGAAASEGRGGPGPGRPRPAAVAARRLLPSHLGRAGPPARSVGASAGSRGVPARRPGPRELDADRPPAGGRGARRGAVGGVQLAGEGPLDLHRPGSRGVEALRDAGTGLPGLPGLRAGLFRALPLPRADPRGPLGWGGRQRRRRGAPEGRRRGCGRVAVQRGRPGRSGPVDGGLHLAAHLRAAGRGAGDGRTDPGRGGGRRRGAGAGRFDRPHRARGRPAAAGGNGGPGGPARDAPGDGLGEREGPVGRRRPLGVRPGPGRVARDRRGRAPGARGPPSRSAREGARVDPGGETTLSRARE